MIFRHFYRICSRSLKLGMYQTCKSYTHKYIFLEHCVSSPTVQCNLNMHVIHFHLIVKSALLHTLWFDCNFHNEYIIWLKNNIHDNKYLNIFSASWGLSIGLNKCSNQMLHPITDSEKDLT
jgi:hypothetical protein